MKELCYFCLDQQWEIKIHLLWGKCFNVPHWPKSHFTNGTRVGMVWLKLLILGTIDGVLCIVKFIFAKKIIWQSQVKNCWTSESPTICMMSSTILLGLPTIVNRVGKMTWLCIIIRIVFDRDSDKVPYNIINNYFSIGVVSCSFSYCYIHLSVISYFLCSYIFTICNICLLSPSNHLGSGGLWDKSLPAPFTEESPC